MIVVEGGLLIWVVRMNAGGFCVMGTNHRILPELKAPLLLIWVWPDVVTE